MGTRINERSLCYGIFLNNEGHPNPTCRGADVPVLGFHSILHITEAFRLLRKSIIHVETEDITFEEEAEAHLNGQEDNQEVSGDQRDAKISHPGEYDENDIPPKRESMQIDPLPGGAKKRKKAKKKKKTQITFEEY